MPDKQTISILLSNSIRSELKTKGILIASELEKGIVQHMYVRMIEHKEIVGIIDNHSLTNDELDLYMTSAVNQIIGDAYNHHMLKETSDLNEFKDRFDRDLHRTIRCIEEARRKAQQQEKHAEVNSILHKAGNLAKKVFSTKKNGNSKSKLRSTP